jgi:hypothetical protein
MERIYIIIYICTIPPVSSDNPDLKIAILKNAHKQKGEESKFDKITLSHDMTRTERQEDKKLYKEAKEMEKKSKGHFLCKDLSVLVIS